MKELADIKRVEMVDYESTKDHALFSFIGEKGTPTSLWVHRSTFISMMGKWDKEKLGEMSIQQTTLRTNLLTTYKMPLQEWPVWFETMTNDILKRKANTRRPY